MSCRKSVIMRLSCLKDMEDSIPDMEKEIARIVRKGLPGGMKAVDTTAVRVSGGGDDTEALTDCCRIKYLQQEIADTREETAALREALESISDRVGCEVYGRLLTAWYVDGVGIEEVAERIGYKSTHLYGLRNLAVQKLAVRLYGVMALDEQLAGVRSELRLCGSKG